MKKLFLSTIIISTAVFASNIDNSLINKNSINELKIANSVLTEKVEKNSCKIVKLEKALARLISKKSKDKPKLILPVLSNVEIGNYSKIKPNVVCTTVKEKKLDLSRINESYYKYKTPKKFTVLYRRAGEFNYPVLESSVKHMLHRGDKFVADLYTKAGWVHNVNGGWVKGYKLNPKVSNKVTQADVKKWGHGKKWKIIEKKTCKGVK